MHFYCTNSISNGLSSPFAKDQLTKMNSQIDVESSMKRKNFLGFRTCSDEKVNASDEFQPPTCYDNYIYCFLPKCIKNNSELTTLVDFKEDF